MMEQNRREYEVAKLIYPSISSSVDPIEATAAAAPPPS